MFRADLSKRLIRSFASEATVSPAPTASSLTPYRRMTAAAAAVEAAPVADGDLSAAEIKDSAKKLWGSLQASKESLLSPVTGEAGAARITHNMIHGDNQWQASCVEVRCRDDVNPVIMERRQALRGSNGKLPWEKNKPNTDDGVEVVFYFETHTKSGLDGYQHTAERVAVGELPGECSNLTGIGGFATWVVPRNEFIAMLQERPMLEGSVFGSGGHHTDEEDHHHHKIIYNTNRNNNNNNSSGVSGSSSSSLHGKPVITLKEA